MPAPTFAPGSQRALFDIPEGLAYFNTAYIGAQLNASRAALVTAAGAKSHPWERPASDFFDDAEQVRELAAGLFGGGPDGWAVIPGVSYGISAAARVIEPQLRAGDRIVVLDEEFPSNVLPWRRVAQETGAVIATVPTPADGDWTAAVVAMIGRGCRVAAVSNCHWTNGARLDLAAIGHAARAAGAMLVIDISQSLGAMPVDLDAVQPDFMISAGYKWLLCPYGFGLMYVSPAWRETRPLEESWLARLGAEDFAGLVNYSDAYRPGARRFDVSEACTTLLPGAIAALEQLSAWGVAKIAASLSAVSGQLQAGLEPLGFTLPPPDQRCPHLFGARLPERFRGDFVGALRARKVYVSQRGSSIRFAPHLHVTQADIAQLFAAVEATLG